MVHQGFRTLAGQLAAGVMFLRNPNGNVMTGFVSPNLQSMRVVHNSTEKEVLDQVGDCIGLIYSNSHLEVTFDFIEGGENLQEAVLSAQIPEAGGTASITGLPRIPKGPFADAFNTDGANHQPWIYPGGENFTLPSDDKATGTITLKRYPKITSGIAKL